MTQSEALNILKTGANVFLTGAAGSGKTHLLNEYIALLRKHDIPVGITASTGIAATHIGGLTIHSWAGIGIARDLSDDDIERIAEFPRVANRMRETRVLIIDEISMLDASRLDLVDRVARYIRGSFEPFGGMQVVLCGDFFQLPPVTLKEEEAGVQFSYRADAWKNGNFRVCYLHERHRHEDDSFFEMLDAIRASAADETTREKLLATGSRAQNVSCRPARLYSHNADVDAENARELAKLSGEERSFHMSASGNRKIAEFLKKNCLAPEELVLKQGAEVMFVKNNFEEGYVNGTLGTVAGFDKDSGNPIVRTRAGKEHVAFPMDWGVEDNGKILAAITQVPLRLAWAITIHKSQGMTLDAAEIDLSDAFEAGMGYVALSRVRTLAGLRVTGLNDTALAVHPEITELDGELQDLSEAAREQFNKMSAGEREEAHRAHLGEVQAAPAAAKKKRGRKSTVAETKELLESGLSLAEIAAARQLAQDTVLDHLEKIAAEQGHANLARLKNEVPEGRFERITQAFAQIEKESGTTSRALSPVRQLLGDGYSYIELRIVRLFL
jgi:ATP-dependent DNA helicase PIF1